MRLVSTIARVCYLGTLSDSSTPAVRAWITLISFLVYRLPKCVRVGLNGELRRHRRRPRRPLRGLQPLERRLPGTNLRARATPGTHWGSWRSRPRTLPSSTWQGPSSAGRRGRTFRLRSRRYGRSFGPPRSGADSSPSGGTTRTSRRPGGRHRNHFNMQVAVSASAQDSAERDPLVALSGIQLRCGEPS